MQVKGAIELLSAQQRPPAEYRRVTPARRGVAAVRVGRGVNSLSAGEHYMQVSKWLGHAGFVTTIDVYGDYISKTEGGKQAPLMRPVVAPAPIQDQTVVNLR